MQEALPVGCLCHRLVCDLTCTALHAEAYASEAYLEAEVLDSADFSKQDLQYRLLVGTLRVTSSQVRGDLHAIHVHSQEIPGCEVSYKCFSNIRKSAACTSHQTALALTLQSRAAGQRGKAGVKPLRQIRKPTKTRYAFEAQESPRSSSVATESPRLETDSPGAPLRWHAELAT